MRTRVRQASSYLNDTSSMARYGCAILIVGVATWPACRH